MFKNLAARSISASVLALALAAVANAQTPIGAADLADVAVRSLAPATGLASGTWIQSDATKGLFYGELRDQQGVVLYGLRATTHAISAANGSIDGVLVARLASNASMKQVPLRVIGQYIVSDATSGVFRAFVMLDIGAVGLPMIPVGLIDGRYARLHAQDVHQPGGAGQADPTLRNTHTGGPTKLPIHVQKVPTAGQADGVKIWGPGGIFQRPVDRSADVQKKSLIGGAGAGGIGAKQAGVFTAKWNLGN